MNKKQLMQNNFDFIQKILQIADERGAQFAVTIALNERNEIIIVSHPGITTKQLYELFRDAGNNVASQAGGIIQI